MPLVSIRSRCGSTTKVFTNFHEPEIAYDTHFASRLFQHFLTNTNYNYGVDDTFLLFMQIFADVLRYSCKGTHGFEPRISYTVHFLTRALCSQMLAMTE